MALEVDSDRKEPQLGGMVSVRSSLLAILTMGPAYGFQLHGELATRTAGRRPVNVGQIYSTLERLVGQGAVEPAGSTPDGLPLYSLTALGRTEAQAWLRATDSDAGAEWNDMVDRVLIASSLPHVDLSPVLAGYRTAWLLRLDRAGEDGLPSGETGQERLGRAAQDLQSRAALAWLDIVADTGADTGVHLHRGLSQLRPKRGRRPAAPA